MATALFVFPHVHLTLTIYGIWFKVYNCPIPLIYYIYMSSNLNAKTYVHYCGQCPHFLICNFVSLAASAEKVQIWFFGLVLIVFWLSLYVTKYTNKPNFFPPKRLIKQNFKSKSEGTGHNNISKHFC